MIILANGNLPHQKYSYFLNILLYSDDDHELEQVIHDIDTAVDKVKAWKAHIIRTMNQETAKTVVLGNLGLTQIMLVIDWAMKFIPSCYRESKQIGTKKKAAHGMSLLLFQKMLKTES